MLRDRYESDPAFWAVIEQQAFKMEPEWDTIDRLLEDEVLYQLIKTDLAKHRPNVNNTNTNPGSSGADASTLASKVELVSYSASMTWAAASTTGKRASAAGSAGALLLVTWQSSAKPWPKLND